jgi:hypothetical protein
VFRHGERAKLPMLLSHYAADPVRDGQLRWVLRDEHDAIVSRGERAVGDVQPGRLVNLGEISVAMPLDGPPKTLTLHAMLDGVPIFVDNAWDVWSFPAVDMPAGEHIVRALSPADLQAMQSGKRFLLLGTGGLPNRETHFQSAFAGRPQGNAGTVIAEHPCWGDFPRGEYCQWQFRNLIDDGLAVVFDELDSPFDPILEIISTYKDAHPQAALFEYRLGAGGLLACTLNLPDDDLAARYLVTTLSRYLQSDAFRPTHEISLRDARRLCGVQREAAGPALTDTDIGFDPTEA